MTPLRKQFDDDMAVTKAPYMHAFSKGLLFAILLSIAFEISNETPTHAIWAVISFLLICIILLIMQRCGISFLSFRALSLSDWLLVIAGLLLMIGLDNLFAYFIDANNVNDDNIFNDFKDVPTWAAILSIAVIPAISEEIVMRGIVMRVFFRNHLFIGMIVSSIIFAWLHEADSLIGYLPYFYSGIIFALVYLKTKRIEAAILVHFFNNLLSTLFI
ncbi:CPBP family intramembrane glutamic endopeptidase [Staphylococcus agnetis]|uniref:CPBP family intramembrane glutamic endopeptidase n=2 Tax=Staphylococcus agnetis TaxID=985762 RepID=UPI0004E3020B|nr:type II CAAX endopeptidase family protein [Staphylococcus agnetis]KFE41737.1 abortive infection protein [Staphylococcus agnetis]NJH64237.1 CPBP family intramembrane metalloprotease [Staphylococcus agnetis]NJH97240.1 CPBP family intramembrane metalloprotease [Staphylococcus agnetis]PTH49302.1 CPBP family intramembrane metalloprotease [Staphylococcus agnetis]PTH73036.1 CPBP family intramembrane metalloprotease [Staphylococcus agnetis]